jgi:orotidine-5'-phosphate decarboxylase
MPEIIVALDYPDARQALRLVDDLGPEADFFKVGLELFIREGPPIVEALGDRGKRVFLDLKLHDIPNTVASAVRSAAALGVDLLTVHLGGGESMLRAAAEAAGAAAAEAAGVVEAVEATGPDDPGAQPGLRLLGVTVLTSLPVTEVEEVWGREISSLRDEVLRLAELGHQCGLRGLVASAKEAEDLRRRFGPGTLIVTPGIRPAGSETHDQERVATPGGAVRAGADLLVVGRSITQAPDPLQAFRGIQGEAEAAAREEAGA